MTTDLMSRSSVQEVQLGTCPRDAGDMFHREGEIGNLWVCGKCGLTTHGDPLDVTSLWEGSPAPN
jgi:hypothetical protein